ncbi:MAG: hypothetical protein PHD30_06735 [Paludibacter sp.]|nr:hypothetical protein [Paludibacter sp.]
MKTNSTFFNERLIRSMMILLIVFCAWTSVHAAKFTFNGTTNTDWATASNWDTGTLPKDTDNVIIAPGKTAVISSTISVALDFIQLEAASSLVNQGTLNLKPKTDFKGGLVLFDASFANEGTLSINTAASSPIKYHCIDLKKTTTGQNMVFLNGTCTFTVSLEKGGRYLFCVQPGTSNYIGGNLTLGSSEAGAVFGLIKFNGSESTVYIDEGANITHYTQFANDANFGDIWFAQNNSKLENEGKIKIIATAGQGTNACNAFYFNPPSNNQVNTLINRGTIEVSGNSTGFLMASGATSGVPGVINVTNSGTIDLNVPTAPVAMSVKNATNVDFTNSGTLKLNAGTNAIKSLANLELSQVINNTGTITVAGGSLMGDITAPAVAPVLNNNTNGVLNFNYGVAAGTTPATAGTVTVNNAGGTITGSCTFAAGTLNTANGTLSPGDDGTGIGKMILTPVGGAFTLSGNVTAQVNGKATAGTDFDQIAFTEACALTLTDANALNLTVGYTPAKDDKVRVIGSTTVNGTFANPAVPTDWLMDYAGGDVAVTFIGGTGVKNPLSGFTKVYVAANQLHVNLEKADGAVVEFMDMTGRMVKSVAVQGLENTIPINNLKGVYMIRVVNPAFNDCYKVIL